MNTEPTTPTPGQIQDRYLAKVNALVTADREHLIAEIVAEYARVHKIADEDTAAGKRHAA